MDLKRIETLLSKYYEGETALDEEKELKNFFSQNDVPHHLSADKLHFQFYNEAANEHIDKAFEEKLAGNFKTKPQIIPIYNRKKNRVRSIRAIAASLLILSGLIFFLSREGVSKKNSKTDDPQIAYAQTKKALLLISAKLNKGNSNLSKISKLNEIQVFLTKKK